MIGVRFATQSDIPAIVDMTGHFLEQTDYGKLHAFDPDHVGELAELILSGWGAVILGERDGVVVGMLALFIAEQPISGARNVCEELCWWVEPAHRYGTLGYKMLRLAEDWARQNGADVLKMVAPAGSAVGTFYERRGYSPVETAYTRRLA